MHDATKHFKNTLSSLEKMLEFRYFLILLSFTLSLDIFSLVVYQKNILVIFSNLNYENIDIVYLVIFFIIYSFFMTLFSPVSRSLFQIIVTGLNFYKKQKLAYDHQELWIVKKKALINKDTFLLSLVNAKEVENKENEFQLNIAFSIGLLMLADYFISQSSIFHFIRGLIVEYNGIKLYLLTYAGIIFIGAICVLFYLSILPNQLEQIYLPRKNKKVTSGTSIA